jgi:hypothetical protein
MFRVQILGGPMLSSGHVHEQGWQVQGHGAEERATVERGSCMKVEKQNEDGTWSEAEPLPYYYDNRCIARRIFDVMWGLLTFQWLAELTD